MNSHKFEFLDLAGDKFTLRLLIEMFRGEENKFFTESFDPVKASIIYGYEFSKRTQYHDIYYICEPERKDWVKSVHEAFPFDYNLEIRQNFDNIRKDNKNVLVISELDNHDSEYSDYLYAAVHENVFKSSEREFYSTYKGSVSKEIAISLGNESGPRITLGGITLLFCDRSDLSPADTVAIIGWERAVKYSKEIKSKIPPMPPSAFESSRKCGSPAKIVHVNLSDVHLVGKVDALICGDVCFREVYYRVLVHLLRHNDKLKVCFI